MIITIAHPYLYACHIFLSPKPCYLFILSNCTTAAVGDIYNLKHHQSAPFVLSVSRQKGPQGKNVNISHKCPSA